MGRSSSPLKKNGGEKKRTTNPNAVNQYTPPDPRQALFLSLYFDPSSETFANCLQSAIAAGYEQSYAEHLTAQMPAWFSEKLRENFHEGMLRKATRNLDAILDLDPKVQAMGAFGPIYEKVGEDKRVKIQGANGKMKWKKIPAKKVAVMKIDPSLLKIKKDTSEFVAETVGKKTFSKQQDKVSFNFAQFNDVKEKYT